MKPKSNWFGPKYAAANGMGLAVMKPVCTGLPASACVGCGECVARCTLGLDIPNLLARVKETMGKIESGDLVI